MREFPRRFLLLIAFVFCLSIPAAALAKSCPDKECGAPIPDGNTTCPVCGMDADATEDEVAEIKEKQKTGERRFAGTEPQKLVSEGKAAPSATREGQHVKVWGKAPKMPDGAVFSIAVHFHSEFNPPFAIDQLKVQGGAWELSFGPFDKPLPAGYYFVDVDFDLSDHFPKFRKAFADAVAALGGTVPEYERFQERYHFSIGTDADIDAETAEDQKYLKEALDEAKAAMIELQDAYYPALKARFKGKREDWEAWVTGMQFVDSKDAEELDRLYKDERFVKNGELDEPAWREWLDKEWRPRVEAFYASHQERVAKFAAQRFPQADTNLDQIYSSLWTLSAEWSRDLYKHSSLDEHANDLEGLSWAPAVGRQITIYDLGDMASEIFHYAKLDEYLRKLEGGGDEEGDEEDEDQGNRPK